MLITCPNCATGYDVPDHMLVGPVTRLCCARCSLEWDEPIHVPPEPVVVETRAEPAREPPPPLPPPPLPPPPPPPAPPPPLDPGLVLPEIRLSRQAPIRASPYREPPRLAALVAAWVLSLVVVGSLGWGVWHWRSDVMAMWPPSQRVLGPISAAG